MDSFSNPPDGCPLRKLTLLSDTSSDSDDGDLWPLRATACQYLLSSGMEVNGRNCDGCTPLHVAVSESKCLSGSEGSDGNELWDDCEIIKMLLSYGAKVNGTNGGKTTLHFAANSGEKELQELLLDHRTESWPTVEDGAYALNVAKAVGRRGVVGCLCQQAEGKICERLRQLETACAELRKGQQEVLTEVLRKMEVIENLVAGITDPKS